MTSTDTTTPDTITLGRPAWAAHSSSYLFHSATVQRGSVTATMRVLDTVTEEPAGTFASDRGPATFTVEHDGASWFGDWDLAAARSYVATGSMTANREEDIPAGLVRIEDARDALVELLAMLDAEAGTAG